MAAKGNGCGQVVEPISGEDAGEADGGRLSRDGGSDTDSGDAGATSCTGMEPHCTGCCGETIAAECTDAGWQCPEFNCPIGICDAGPNDDGGTCAALETAAEANLANAEKRLLACQEDSDCVWAFVNQSGYCSAPCGGLADNAEAFLEAAATACATFNAQGCTPPEIGCPVGPPAICAAGTCATYGLTITQSSTSLTHGQCGVLDANFYELSATDAGAPHDLAITISASDGTLYLDSACTTPLTTGTITIPSGSSSVAFGLIPQAAGNVFISYNQSSVAFAAQ